MTNFEKIKGMDSYDMATFMKDFSVNQCEHCGFSDTYKKCNNDLEICALGHHKWLMQEIDERNW